MPDLIASIDHLADIPLYEEEKPYVVLVSPENRGSHITNNLVFETHSGIQIADVRGKDDEFTLEKVGFEVMAHKSNIDEPRDARGALQISTGNRSTLEGIFPSRVCPYMGSQGTLKLHQIISIMV